MVYCVYFIIWVSLLILYFSYQWFKVDLEIREQVIDNLVIETQLEDIRRIDDTDAEIQQYKKEIEYLRGIKKTSCVNLGDAVPYRQLESCWEPK